MPGVTPQLLQSATELLKQEGIRREGNPPPSQNKSPQASPNIKSTPTVDQKPAKPETIPPKAGYKTHEDTQVQTTPIVRRTQEDLYKDASNLSQLMPQTYPTPQDAMSRVLADENTRITNLEEQRKVAETKDALLQRVRGRVTQTWEKDKVIDQIPGTVQNNILRQVEDALADPNNKKPESQLIDEAKAKGKNYAQAMTNLSARSRLGFLAKDYSADKVYSTIKEAQKAAEDAEALEEFNDSVSSTFNLTPQKSAYLTHPPKNKILNEQYDNLKPRKYTKYGAVDPKEVEQKTAKAADIFMKNAQANDSILSYATKLNGQDLNPDLFVQLIAKASQDGSWTPSDFQSREIQKGYSSFPSLGDFYLFNMMNIGKYVK